MKDSGLRGIQLLPNDMFELFNMLYADDIVFMANTVINLKRIINILHEFTIRWKMTINLAKTKIVVHRNGGHLSKNEMWYFGNQLIQTVGSYEYLSLIMSCKCSWQAATKQLAIKAKKKIICVRKCFKHVEFLPVDIYFKLFDVMIFPLITYGSEIWGFKTYPHLESIHTDYCKKYLGLARTASSCMVMGDCGQLPLFCYYSTRCIKYWLRVTRLGNERLPNKAYKMLLIIHNQGKRTWATEIMHLLDNLGFGTVWENQGVENTELFLLEFKSRAQNEGKRIWYLDICTAEKTVHYRQFKFNFGRESYLKLSINTKLRRAYARLRCSNHHLAIEVGRHRGIDREYRICDLCLSGIEDEFHFLLKCPKLDTFRQKFLPQSLQNYASNTLYDFHKIMASDNVRDIESVALFCFNVFKIKEKL